MLNSTHTPRKVILEVEKITFKHGCMTCTDESCAIMHQCLS